MQVPTVAYVDDVWSHQAFLQTVADLRCVLADITHLMRRYRDTLVPHHPATGLSACYACQVEH